ncbi:MAG: acryloyl-CoA reductase [Gammaproteobacteria bacterium]|nr:MAG: acryloyl-CoA reductase [Gammaproteobacteria bacterium]
MDKFRAFRIHDDKGRAGVEQLSLDDLSPGEVVIKTAFSDINYKDALAATGKGKILRKHPLIGGIDVSGTVVSSSEKSLRDGDEVLVTGHGLSEEHDGGYAEYVRVPADWVVPLPAGMTLFDAMALGTAGFTAGLAIHQMEHNGQTPDRGPIAVNGATGGVGSLAIDMLAGLGYQVVAITGKTQAHDYLKGLGAGEIRPRQELEMGKRPLEKALWGGAVDSLGGEMLAWLTRTVEPLGNIASIGLAAGYELHTTVMPFILRGVNLLGINSSYCPRDLRLHIWERLASDMRPRRLDQIVTRTVSLDEMSPVFENLVAGTATGRTVVKIGSQD